jgi:geranylgeranyl pyrophosphate synthase
VYLPVQVIKLISQVIADFADGEISQAASLFDPSIDLQRYLDKSFWKTASLIAASCRSAAVFSDCDVEGGRRIKGTAQAALAHHQAALAGWQRGQVWRTRAVVP